MQGHDTGRHSAEAYDIEPGIAQHLGKLFRPRMHANGFGQIAIAGFIIGDPFA